MTLFPVITIFAIVSIVMMLLAILAFRYSSKDVGEPTWWFMMGFGVMAIASNARGIYWDVFWSILRNSDPASAEAWSDATGGTAINIMFYIPTIFGAYCILKCKQTMVEQEENIKAPWYRAWLHPDTIRIFRWPSKW